MRRLRAQDIARIWERGEGRTPLEKSLLLVLEAFPDRQPSELAGMTVGERDAAILKLRELTFGSKLTALVGCPQCSEKLEFVFNAADIAPSRQSRRLGEELLEWTVGNCRLQVRLLNIRDLLAIRNIEDLNAAAAHLLERCVVEARVDGQAVAPSDLPQEVVKQLGDFLAESDPQSEVCFSVDCVSCGHQWPATFDPASYFWEEIATRAQIYMFEVHRLASAYGWTESEILGMSAAKRRLLLEMVD